MPKRSAPALQALTDFKALDSAGEVVVVENSTARAHTRAHARTRGNPVPKSPEPITQQARTPLSAACDPDAFFGRWHRFGPGELPPDDGRMVAILDLDAETLHFAIHLGRNRFERHPDGLIFDVRPGVRWAPLPTPDWW